MLKCFLQHSAFNVFYFPVKKPRKKAKPYYYTDFTCLSHPHMVLVGRKCYFFSIDGLNWNDAYWACRQNKTKLAVISTKLQDNILRGFLNKNFVGKCVYLYNMHLNFKSNLRFHLHNISRIH